MTLECVSITDTVETMIGLRIKQLVFPDGLQIELHDSAFTAAAPVAEQSDTIPADNEQCHCGHSLVTHHNGNGQCIEGCDPEQCEEHPDKVQAK